MTTQGELLEPSPSPSGLPTYLDAVERRVLERVCGAGLPDDLTKLLLAGSWRRRKRGPLAHPLAPLYFTFRAGGAVIGDATTAIGASFVLMFRSQSVLDDVQDGALTGPLNAAGQAVAINCGVGLLYLGLDTLWGVANELGRRRGEALRRIVSVHMIRSGIGQHQDLTGRGRPTTAEQALETGVEKSAVFSLLFELAGLCTLSDGDALPPEYRVIGDAMAEIHQLVNDVDDLFSGASDDLRNGSWNVVLAMMLDGLGEDERTAQAEGMREADAAKVRDLVYESGAVDRVAELAEAARRRVHASFASIVGGGPYLALVLAWIDNFVSKYYFPPPLREAIDVDATDARGLPTEDAVLLEGLKAKRTWVVQQRP